MLSYILSYISYIISYFISYLISLILYLSNVDTGYLGCVEYELKRWYVQSGRRRYVVTIADPSERIQTVGDMEAYGEHAWSLVN